MLTYAMGRGIEYYEKPAVDGIGLLAKNEYRFSRLVVEMTKRICFACGAVSGAKVMLDNESELNAAALPRMEETIKKDFPSGNLSPSRG